MKLQINAAGSWRHMLDFDAGDVRIVASRAVLLVRATRTTRCRLRVLNDDGSEKAFCEAPDYLWTEH